MKSMTSTEIAEAVKAPFDPRAWPGAEAAYMVQQAERGFLYGAIAGACLIPPMVMKYGAPHVARGHPHWAVAGLGRFAVIGAAASALLGAIKISQNEHARVAQKMSATAHTDARRRRAQLGAAVGCVALAAISQRAVVKGSLGGAAIGALAGVAYHLYDEYSLDRVKIPVPEIHRLNLSGVMDSTKNSMDKALHEL